MRSVAQEETPIRARPPAHLKAAPPRRELSPRVRAAVVVGLALVAVLPVLARYGHTYFFYDEWGMIDRVTSGQSHLTAAFANFNGHLWVFPYLVYLGQVRWFGLAGHWPVFLVFCASLVALHLALVGVLRSLEVPLPAAFAAATVVTYFGPGSQSMVFEVQLSWNLAAALGVLALVIVLRAPPRWTWALLAGASLLVAAGWDGVGATLIGVFVLVMAAGRWSPRLAPVPVLPAGLLMAGWRLSGRQGGTDSPPASIAAGARFAYRLVLSGVGGLVGGGEVLGAAAAVALVAVIAVALRRGRLRSTSRLVLVAGGLATAAAVGLLSWTRAGLVKGDLRDYNRYIQLVAIFLAVMALPGLADTWRARRPRVDRRRGALVAGALAVVFVVNLSPMRSYRRTFELWNTQTHALVARSVTALAAGCPHGSSPDPTAQPLGSLGPQISVALLERLRAQHVALPAAASADPSVVRAICAGAHR